MLTADEIIARLGLRPHPEEGGFFAETYRAAERLEAPGLHSRYAGPRAVSTAIYYLLTLKTVSALHRLASDEVFHFYLETRWRCSTCCRIGLIGCSRWGKIWPRA
jgi:predicted cupin superfamily sugar epimerase